jgi:hypothetical protein
VSQGYKLYLTYRSEYLVLQDLCVGVRDRRTSGWLAMHAATCSHVLGPVDAATKTPLVAGSARVGEHLCLYSAARRIVTGPIVAIEQPSRRLLRDAERQWQELFQPSDPRHSGVWMASKEPPT